MRRAWTVRILLFPPLLFLLQLVSVGPTMPPAWRVCCSALLFSVLLACSHRGLTRAYLYVRPVYTNF